MITIKKITNIIVLILLIVLGSCTEQIPIEDLNFEDVLVVEGSITNELKLQTIKLSRTTQLTDTLVDFENNAQVSVQVIGGERYDFIQNEEGLYISNQAFGAIAKTQYQLEISTKDGKKYESTSVTLAEPATIENVYPESAIVDNKLKAGVFVDAKGGEDSPSYLRYEFEETYKIKTPVVSDIDAQLQNYIPNADGACPTFDIVITPKTELTNTCYPTKKSEGIIQVSTNGLANNSIKRFPVNYIDASSPKLISRYSILVRQYSQSLSAYTFYQTLNDLGSPESVLSESQPGFVSGNISEMNDPKEKVLGFFEVASVTQKRIYFNHVDLDFQVPDYYDTCETVDLDYDQCSPIGLPGDQRTPIAAKLANGAFVIINNSGSQYTLIKKICADCTDYGTNVKPDFWID